MARLLAIGFACSAAACNSPLLPTVDGPSVGLGSNSSNPVAVGAQITFTLTVASPGNPANVFIKSADIDFGDGQSMSLGTVIGFSGGSSGPGVGTVPHIYSQPGTFQVVATATDTSGNTGRATLKIVVSGAHTPPSVGLTSTATNPTAVGTVVTFTVLASIPGNPANEFIQNVRLDFGDGQVVDLGATPPSGGVTHSYAVAGTYTVTAIASTTAGLTAAASQSIVVSGVTKLPTPSVGLTSNAANPTPVGTTVTFSVSASIPGNPANDFIQRIRVDFGDGQTADVGAAATSITHVYGTAGTYTIKATATDTNGTDGSASLTIIVK